MNEDLGLTRHNFTPDLIDQFEQDCINRSFTKESARHYVSNTRVFIDFLNHRALDMAEINKYTIVDFIQYLRNGHGTHKGVGFKTLNNYMTVLTTFYSYLYFNDYVPAHLLETIRQVRKRYLRRYKQQDPIVVRKLITVEQMSKLAMNIMNPRDRAIVVLLAKTGIRRNELISIDIEDVDLKNFRIMLKPQHKRTNCMVFFDHETERVLKCWMETRAQLGYPDEGPLFFSQQCKRLKRQGLYCMILKHAQRLGLHNPHSKRKEDHFTPHCFRHWFTTYLNRAGMKREYIAWLRGDRMNREAQDTYIHIDQEDVLGEYLRRIPQLGL